MQFQPGNNANPNGRPKGALNKVTLEIKHLCQKHGPAAVKLLVATMESETEAMQMRIAAAKEILDRGYGRPPQAIVGEDGEARIVNFTMTLQGHAGD
jgi:hypothetical protein